MSFETPNHRLPAYRGAHRRFHPYRRLSLSPTDGITRTENRSGFSLPPLFSVSRVPGPVLAFVLVHPLQRTFIMRDLYILVVDTYADRLIFNVISYPPVG